MKKFLKKLVKGICLIAFIAFIQTPTLVNFADSILQKLIELF